MLTKMKNIYNKIRNICKTKFILWISPISPIITAATKVLNENKKFIVVVTLIASIIVLSIIGYLVSGYSIGESFLKAFSILSLHPPKKQELNFFNGLAFILAVIVVYIGVVILMFRKSIEKSLYKVFLQKENIILFGFGETNRIFLENFKNSNRKENVIVIDKKDRYFDDFAENGYIFLKKEINKEFLKNLNFEKTSNVIINLGKDEENIDLAIDLLSNFHFYETNFLVYYENDEINDLFFAKIEEIAKKDIENKINIKIFSLNSEIVDDLFFKYDIKLVPDEYALFNSSKNELKVAIVGNSNLSLKIIKKIISSFIFSNDLKIKIILIDEKIEDFERYVKYKIHYSPDKYSHIEFETKELNYNLIKDKIFWKQTDLVDVIIAFEDGSKNLKIALDLFEYVFVYDKNIKYPNIYFTIFNEIALSKYITENENKFENFYTFGNLKDVLSIENLFDEEKFDIAKQIHYEYGSKYEKDKMFLEKEKLNEKWFISAKYTDKLSTIAQYEHITYKLLSLGLYKEKTNEKPEKLLKENQKILLQKLENLEMLDEKIIKEFSLKVENDAKKNELNEEIVGDFFEKLTKKEKFYKLVNTEHKRWMVYHYLNGWIYDDEKNKSNKLHNCLTDIEKFDYKRKSSIIYDMYSYLYLPNYLAATGYSIKEISLKER